MAKSVVLDVKILADAIGAAKGFGEAETHASRFQRAMGFTGKAVLGLAAAAGTAAAAAATGLYKIGESWAGVANGIRAGTGATGAAFEGLLNDAKAIGRDVPADMAKVGTTVADLNTRLGLSGKTLQDVGKQYLEAGRILKEDIDINQTAAALKAFGLEGAEVSSAMDSLFRASQATGVGMTELASGVQKAAPALVTLGFTFEDSIALMGSLDKAGLNSQQMAAALTRSLTSLAKEGEQPASTFRRIVGELDGYVKAGDTASALQLSSKIFGTRGAPQFVHAIQSGVLELENLTAAAGVTKDTIMGVAGETMTAADQWKLLKNNAMLALEPLGSAVFKAVGDALGTVAKAVQDVDFSFITEGAAELKNLFAPLLAQIAPAVGSLIPRVIELATAFSPLKLVLQALSPIIPAMLDALSRLGAILSDRVMPIVSEILAAAVPILQNLAAAIMPALIAVFDAVIPTLSAVLEAILPVISTIVEVLTPAIEALTPVIGAVFNGAAAIISGAMELIHGIITAVTGLISGDWSAVWTGIKMAISGVWTAIRSIVSTAIGVVKGIISTALALIGSLWSTAWNGIKAFLSNSWTSITSSVSNGVRSVVEFFKQLPGQIGSALAGLPGQMLSIGGDMIRGMIRGVGSMGSALVNKVKGIASRAVSGVKSFLGIASPSRVFAQIGIDSGRGMIKGIAATTGKVADAFHAMVTPPEVPTIAAPRVAIAAAGSRGGITAAAAPINIEINGALDPVAVARQIRDLLRRYGHLIGSLD